MQLSTAIRNAQLDLIESTIGATAKLYLRTAAAADCAAADAGALLATLTLPVDWLNDAAGGQKTIKGGPWTGTASGAGTTVAFRVKDNGGTTCGMQGTCGLGAGELSFDNNNLAVAQNISITAYTLTAGNA